MFCPSCGNEITVELKYCNRCGANLTLTHNNFPATIAAPVKLTVPTIVLGLTIVIGLGIIFGGVNGLAQIGVHPAAITWIALFSGLTLFGSIALLLRFWSKTLSVQQQILAPPPNLQSTVPPTFVPQQLPPRYDPTSSVTEHTTRTFSPIYREPSDPT
ncbi:MAG TPA: zinc ribbon domain-containing protein [Pyrinomonadaceae bacterium]|nr:zinc ribbon domain-containing protein [Pyrinomonadaceae bacterium]